MTDITNVCPLPDRAVIVQLPALFAVTVLPCGPPTLATAGEEQLQEQDILGFRSYDSPTFRLRESGVTVSLSLSCIMGGWVGIGVGVDAGKGSGVLTTGVGTGAGLT